MGNAMTIGLLVSFAISLFALGGALVLLRQLRDSRFWFLVATTAFAAAVVTIFYGAQIFTLLFAGPILATDFRKEFPALIMSAMALFAVFYLERMIRERKSLEKELRLREISVGRVAISAYWIGRDGRLLFVNERACECLGYSRDELLSKTIHDIDPNFTSVEWDRHWASLKQHGSLTYETGHRTKDGQVIPMDVTANHLEFDGEEYNCTFARDVTDSKRAEAALREAHNTLEQRVQERTAELQKANADLKVEVAERMRAEEALRENEQILQTRVAELEEAQRTLERQGEDLVRFAEDLSVARDQAEIANRAKSEFLAAMSHELRTPLNAVIGFSEIIKNETFGPVGSVKYRDYASDIHDSGQHLLGLINDILDLSKVESGADELHEDKIEIPEIIRSALKLVGQRAQQRGIKLELELSDQLPALRADERKLKQILVNLLSNAIKFTDAGGEVTLRAWCRMDSGYVFQIVDTGIGIAPKDIPKALARFGQVEGDLNRRYEGTGLGLPLTKALVELHGGVLDLQSEFGVGTTVTVRFPAERIVFAARHEIRRFS